MLRLRTSALAVLAAFTLAACGDDSTGPKNSTGTFSAKSTGGLTRSFSGDAIFGSDDTPEGEAFVVGLLGDAEFVIIGRKNLTRPATGTYSIVDISGETAPTADQFFSVAYFEVNGGASEQAFVSTGGQLKVTTSSSTRFAGTFTMTGVCTACGTGGADVTAEVSGSFNAIGAETPVARATRFHVEQVRVSGQR